MDGATAALLTASGHGPSRAGGDYYSGASTEIVRRSGSSNAVSRPHAFFPAALERHRVKICHPGRFDLGLRRFDAAPDGLGVLRRRQAGEDEIAKHGEHLIERVAENVEVHEERPLSPFENGQPRRPFARARSGRTKPQLAAISA